MTPGRARDAEKERQWRRWIARLQSSGSSVAAFCARPGLSPARFYAWRRTARRRDAERTAFVPMHVVADAAATPVRPLEVVLADGPVVRVAPGFDATTLRQLLAVLREEGPC